MLPMPKIVLHTKIYIFKNEEVLKIPVNRGGGGKFMCKSSFIRNIQE